MLIDPAVWSTSSCLCPSADMSRNDAAPDSPQSRAVVSTELAYTGETTSPIKFNNRMIPPIFFNSTPHHNNSCSPCKFCRLGKVVPVGWVERVIPIPLLAPHNLQFPHDLLETICRAKPNAFQTSGNPNTYQSRHTAPITERFRCASLLCIIAIVTKKAYTSSCRLT